MRGDGDGWVSCALGHPHWGLFGAAGLLLHKEGDGEREVLLQHRAEWSHHGGTWGLLGGARQSKETAVEAALREAGEEGGVPPEVAELEGEYDDDHGGWSYATVLARAAQPVPARPTGGESIDVTWLPVSEVDRLPLHPGFASSWPLLRATLGGLRLVVDAANVVGSRPDGWWRDREGAARRLVTSCRALASAGLADTDLPAGRSPSTLRYWWPQVTVVVEGAAAGAGQLDAAPVLVVVAPASGDDAIVEQAGGPGAASVLVVTADRELRTRCEAVGAGVAGPKWLLGLLDRLSR